MKLMDRHEAKGMLGVMVLCAIFLAFDWACSEDVSDYPSPDWDDMPEGYR